VTRSPSQRTEGEKLDLLRRIKAVAARPDRLFEEDPAAALGAARELLHGSQLDEANRQSLAAGILIDAIRRTA
jgi:hypothetical protein